MVVGTIWVHGQLQMASPGLDDDGDYGVVLPPGGIVCSIGSLEGPTSGAVLHLPH